jgi:hypothetical protein
MISDEELKELEKLCSDATPGPWELLRKEYGYSIQGLNSVTDAKFISASRTMVPKLIDEVKRLFIENTKLKVREAEKKMAFELHDYVIELKAGIAEHKQAVEVMVSVLKEFQPIVERMHWDGRLRDANTFMFSERAKQALNHEAVKKVLDK